MHTFVHTHAVSMTLMLPITISVIAVDRWTAGWPTMEARPRGFLFC